MLNAGRHGIEKRQPVLQHDLSEETDKACWTSFLSRRPFLFSHSELSTFADANA